MKNSLNDLAKFIWTNIVSYNISLKLQQNTSVSNRLQNVGCQEPDPNICQATEEVEYQRVHNRKSCQRPNDIQHAFWLRRASLPRLGGPWPSWHWLLHLLALKIWSGSDAATQDNLTAMRMRPQIFDR